MCRGDHTCMWHAHTAGFRPYLSCGHRATDHPDLTPVPTSPWLWDCKDELLLGQPWWEKGPMLPSGNLPLPLAAQRQHWMGPSSAAEGAYRGRGSHMEASGCIPQGSRPALDRTLGCTLTRSPSPLWP